MSLERLRVLFVSSEIYPLAKTGGLADVSAALPAALAGLGVDMRLVLPAYPQARERLARRSPHRLPLGNLLGAGDTGLITGRMPDSDLPVGLVDCPALFDRPGGLYQDAEGRDWPDNDLRFAVLCHAAWRLATGAVEAGWRADLIHANDWHTGLLPMIAGAQAGPRPRTVFTVHNMAFHGLFPLAAGDRLGLPAGADGAEFYGQLSLLKAGLTHADRLTTVSPTYSREILTPEFGCGLDGLLAARRDVLSGILNGADYSVWDPICDRHLPRRYSRTDLSGKRVCKAEIQAELGLEQWPDVPLIAFMSRITHQKMADAVIEALPALIQGDDVQFALVAEGDRAMEQGFRNLADRFPGRVAARIGYQEPVAHRLQAGADMLLHPSRFEPCGLAPMYAMRYGALPIVGTSGGQVDVVVHACADSLARGTATGFSFSGSDVAAMRACIDQALTLYRQPVAWRRVQLEAMRQDFGWRRPAQSYLELYRSGIGSAATPPVRRRHPLRAAAAG